MGKVSKSDTFLPDSMEDNVTHLGLGEAGAAFLFAALFLLSRRVETVFSASASSVPVASGPVWRGAWCVLVARASFRGKIRMLPTPMFRSGLFPRAGWKKAKSAAAAFWGLFSFKQLDAASQKKKNGLAMAWFGVFLSPKGVGEPQGGEPGSLAAALPSTGTRLPSSCACRGDSAVLTFYNSRACCSGQVSTCVGTNIVTLGEGGEQTSDSLWGGLFSW